MAYNLEYLVKLLDQIIHLPKLDPNKKSEVESLFNTICFVKESFENFPPQISDEVKKLESRITDAAYEAEDIFESYLLPIPDPERDMDKKLVKKVKRFLTYLTNLLPSCEGERSWRRVTEQFGYVRKVTKTIIKDGAGQRSTTIASSSSSAIHVDHNPTNIVVGLSEDINQVMERLIYPESTFEVIPIVGMGGIGKTTLARTVYDNDKFSWDHFYKRAWVTVSQNYEIEEILLALLRCIIDKNQMEKMHELTEIDELSLEVYKTLSGRRYLVVLDDVWSCEVWDELNRFFPRNETGSRIILTTRLENVADYASSHDSHHHMNLLSADDSWNLLRQRIFPGEICPMYLKEIGERIAKDCKGLPLAIHVVGGILSKLSKTPQSWEYVAEDVRAAVATNKDEQMSKILLLSYNHLPLHLKPCFLYLSAFPEDYEIPAKMVIKLWSAEGFLRSCPGKALEEAAGEYLNDLVGRNLVLVSKEDEEGNIKSYVLHDLVRDLCIRKAEEENFLCVKRSQVDATNMRRRVSVHCIGRPENTITTTNFTRSLICFGCTSGDIIGVQLFRVLDVIGSKLEVARIGTLLNLRYLAFRVEGELSSSSLFAMRNLETLILDGSLIERGKHFPPRDIRVKFDMPRLRHLKFKNWIPYYDIPVVLENLETLSKVRVDESLPRLIETAPNLKKLRFYADAKSGEIDVSSLKKLKTLKCIFGPDTFAPCILPSSLKKLVIQADVIPVALFINKIGRELPNLEVLKLRSNTWKNRMWEPVEGKYCGLRVLRLWQLKLGKWIADERHYPRLQRLIIRDCELEIPLGIGDIPTLELIEVQDYNLSSNAVLSAQKIQEEQLGLGNESLQVRIVKL